MRSKRQPVTAGEDLAHFLARHYFNKPAPAVLIHTQTIMVDSETGKVFGRWTEPTTFDREGATKRQAFRKRLGGEFCNGWHIVRRETWTEYQRYFTETEATIT